MWTRLLALPLALCVFAAPYAAATKKPPTQPIKINTAGSDQLQLVPRIVPVTAQRILQMRKSYRAFKSVDDLMAVRRQREDGEVVRCQREGSRRRLTKRGRGRRAAAPGTEERDQRRGTEEGEEGIGAGVLRVPDQERDGGGDRREREPGLAPRSRDRRGRQRARSPCPTGRKASGSPASRTPNRRDQSQAKR